MKSGPSHGLLAVLLLAGSAAVSRANEPVSFTRDVMAIFSKAGCNQGACHGNFNGKNGFRLSLRGQSPTIDYQTLLSDQFGRRVNRLEPEQSLLVLKAIAAVPHGGGRRFRKGSEEYQTLVRWIGEGLRADPADLPTLVELSVEPREQYLVEPQRDVQLRATAKFADGSTRDVTRWVVYTPSMPIVQISAGGRVEREQFGETAVLVRYLNRQTTSRLAFVPARPDFHWPNPPVENLIDREVQAKLKKLRIEPAPLCSDTVFVRRAYLDLLGRLPNIDEAQSFISNSKADKRTRLIDALLDEPEFADFWALKWADLLRVDERTLDRKGVQAFYHWIRESIADDRPLNEFAAELLAARGSTYSNPPANFYRGHRDPVTRAEAVGQVFLGVRLQCAKCHNHPFDQWTQDDYYRWAGVFARVNYEVLENRRKDRNDKHEFDGEQIVYTDNSGEVTNPGTGATALPKLLGVLGDLPAEAERLDAVADWIRGADERSLFARVQVNRIWFHLLGRGIVEPVDDFRATNPPSHPKLLDALAHEFVGHDFNVRHIVRVVMNSRTYQLSSETNATNLDDEVNYSHTLPRSLSAEQLTDALHQATGTVTHFRGYPDGLRACQLPGVRTDRSRSRGNNGEEELFLLQFGKPPRQLSCECERSSDATLGQTFQLVSGSVVQQLLTETGNRVGRVIETNRSDGAILDELFWSALSRSPSDAERTALVAHLADSKDRRRALEDILWSLVNSKEFLLRQ